MESGLKIFSNDIPINDKRVIVRLDLNVPINNSKIEDSTRIKIVEPFINKLVENKAKIILLTHLGRQKGKVVSELSLKPIFNYLPNSAPMASPTEDVEDEPPKSGVTISP